MEEGQPETLWGAASIGDVWRFGFLDRNTRRLTQDLHFYTVPDSLEKVLGMLVAVLNG